MSNLDEIRKALDENGVVTSQLTVIYLPAMMLVGEVEHKDQNIVGRPVQVKNPKRIFRAEKRTPEGLETSYGVTDFDLMDGGTISVLPIASYRVADASEATKERVFGLLFGFYQQQIVNRAANAGLHLPEHYGPSNPKA